MRRRIWSLAIGAMVAGLLTVASPGTAFACSCMATSLADRLADGGIGVVFTGTVRDVTEPTSGPVMSSADLLTVHFDVDAVHKGTVGSTAQVRTAVSGASCGVTFQADRRYLVLARTDSNGSATATLCDGSQPLDEFAAADLALLGPGSTPVADPAEPADAAEPVAADGSGSGSGTPPWVAALILLTAAVITAAVVVRRGPGGS